MKKPIVALDETGQPLPSLPSEFIVSPAQAADPVFCQKVADLSGPEIVPLGRTHSPLEAMTTTDNPLCGRCKKPKPPANNAVSVYTENLCSCGRNGAFKKWSQ